MLDLPHNDLDPVAFREMLRAGQGSEETLAETRARIDSRGLAVPPPAGCAVIAAAAGAVPAERLIPREGREDRIVLYVHGGGFRLGSPRSIRHFAARVAEAACASALVPEYRLAPEAPFPAPLDDCLAAYRWLLEQVEPGCIVLAGDSAGGGLALAAALAARDEGLPPPAGLYLISPWVDLAEGGPSYAANAEVDAICSVPEVRSMAADYLGGADPRHPLASPLFADLARLPPMLIQVGSDEILLSDSVRLAERAALAGVEVRLEIAPQMPHGFPIFHEHLAPARRAILEAGAWIAARLA